MAGRALIVAPGLRGAVGHNLAYTQAVETALRDIGWDVTVLIHRHATPEVARRPSFRPTFSYGPYDSPPGNGPWRDLRYFYAQSLIYSLELRRALQGEKFAFAFCHSTLDLELLGWNRFLRGAGFDGHLFMLLRITPRFSELPRWKQWFHPYWRIKPRVLSALHQKLGNRFGLLTDSDELRDDYARIYPHRIVTLPIPLSLPAAAARTVSSAGGRSIGWLGHARPGKGFALLPSLIRSTLASTHSRFVVQCAGTEYDRVELSTLSELRELASAEPARVTLLTQPLSEPEYFQLISSLDVVVLPYTDRYFREGTSNVFAEALAFGKPVVVFGGTWMARQLRDYGAGEVCLAGDVDDLVAAIGRVLADYDHYEERARASAPAWTLRHSPQALVRVLLQECGLGVT